MAHSTSGLNTVAGKTVTLHYHMPYFSAVHECHL